MLGFLENNLFLCRQINMNIWTYGFNYIDNLR